MKITNMFSIFTGLIRCILTPQGHVAIFVVLYPLISETVNDRLFKFYIDL